MRAFLFAGQGQQFESMGRDLADKYEWVAKQYQHASQIVGYDILNLDAAALSRTAYTQVALFVLGTCIDTLLKKENVHPDAVAGLSLGEYNALASAGVMTFEEGLHILKARGALMEHAYPPFETGMVACLKTDLPTVVSAIKGTNLAVCNVNTPSQIVIGGYLKELNEQLPVLKEAGIRLAIPLKVSVVSHMHLLSDAALKLKKTLEDVTFKHPNITFYNNIQGSVQTEGFVSTLSQHIASSTQMAQIIQNMADAGVREFIEIGPKGSISKFVKEICPGDVKVMNIYDYTTLGAYLNE